MLPLQTRDHRPAVKRGAYDLGDTAMRKFLVSALVLVALGLLQAEASHEENDTDHDTTSGSSTSGTTITVAVPHAGPTGATTFLPPGTPSGTRVDSCTPLRYIADSIAAIPNNYSECLTPLTASTFYNPTPPCTGIYCETRDRQQSMSLTVLRCHKPPAINLRIQNGNSVLFNQTFDHSEVVPQSTTEKLNITVSQISMEALGFQVDVIELNTTESLVPYGIITVDTFNCTGTVIPTQPGTGTAIPTEPETGTATPVSQASICAALQSISNNITTTSTNTLDLTCVAPKSGNGTCNNVICTTETGSQLEITVVPCSDPPGFRMVLKDDGSILFDHTFTKDGSVPIPTEIGDFPLDVTVVHLNGNRAIGLTVNFIGMNIVPYTVVPLDTSGCSGKGGVPLAVVIAVPICVVLLLLVVVVVVAVLLYRRHVYRSKPFKPMAMPLSET